MWAGLANKIALQRKCNSALWHFSHTLRQPDHHLDEVGWPEMVGQGFNPGTMHAKSMWASAPEVCFGKWQDTMKKSLQNKKPPKGWLK
jgi:hypothetical protein